MMAALFWFTMRQSLRLRRLWFVVLLLLAPCGLPLILRDLGLLGQLQDVWRVYHAPLVFVLFMLALPLVCMLHGSALIGSEVDTRTLGYLTTRRMRRETVLLVRYAAVGLIITALAEAAVVAFHLCTIVGLDLDYLNETATEMGTPPWDPRPDLLAYLQVIPLAVAAFLAVFTLISLLSRRCLPISILYLIIVEMVVSNTPVKAQVYTISHQLRQMLKASIPDLLDVFTSHRNRQVLESFYSSGTAGLISLLIVIAATLTLACVAMRTRELLPAKVGRD